MKLISCITIMLFLTSSCMSFRPISLESSDIQKQPPVVDLIKQGNRVRITTLDGKQYKFKVVSISDTYIEGQNIKIAAQDVAKVEKLQFSTVRTVILVGLIFLSVEVAIHWIESNVAFMS
jgi:hypothetical protein